jgi:hypothetical protein
VFLQRAARLQTLARPVNEPIPAPSCLPASLDTRLASQPALCARFHALLDVIDAAAGDCVTAAQAEARVIAVVRQMGQEALNGWSQHCHQQGLAALGQQTPGTHLHAKKKSAGIPPSAP